jgi:TonB-linked SusC/RagA family outer membrane protein
MLVRLAKKFNHLTNLVGKPPLRIMKLTAILLTIALLNVHATGFSQTVTITYSGNNISLEKLFTVINQQTGYMFLYTADVIKEAKKVNIHVKNASLEETLRQAMKDQPLKYMIQDKTVIISKNREGDANKKTTDKQGVLPVGVKGRVLNQNGEPLAGANVSVKGTNVGSVTNEKGFFELKDVGKNAVLEISYAGFETKTVNASGKTNLAIQLEMAVNELASVSVSVCNGYQYIPKERATGSFVQIDNKLFNRGMSLDVLGRLEGVASGVAFYRNSKSDQPTIGIRGRSTIFGNATPLIVLDNFPYDGDITNINPNTIESITILRDAAAASIYGVRSANGVIVITSRKGRANQSLQTSFNTNVTVSAKPDLSYIPLLSSSDYIDAEKTFFANGWYASQELSPSKTPFTPVVELLMKARDGLIAAADANQQIEALKKNNVIDQYQKYFFRNEVMLQNALSLSGGGSNSRYFLSLSYDKDQSSSVRNKFDRYSINSSYSFTPFKNVDINAGLIYTNTRYVNDNAGINDFASPFNKKYYPYAQLVDESGNALPVFYGYRDPYKALKESQGFLDWQYRPVDELKLANNVTRQNYNRVNIEVRKTFNSSLNIEVKYQYEKQLRETNNLMNQETYYTRNLINQFYNPTGTIKYPVPLGGILDQTNAALEGHSGRAQLNFNHAWQKHQVNMIGGFEIKQLEVKSNQNRLYGYNDEVVTSQTMDYVTRFPINPSQSLAAVSYPRTITDNLDRFLSYYANASYTYNDRYVFSVSGRFDNTNFFGVKSNQRVVPLWSTGFNWNISREGFFKSALFDELTIRTTYGYNGNLYKDLTAYTTVKYNTDGITKAPTATVVNPPNPELKWERISMANLGVVFALKNHVLSGSVEYFVKKGVDLIGDVSMDPTTGMISFRGNMSDMKGKGWDIQLTGKLVNNKFVWSPTILFSRATDKVTKYDKTFIGGALIQQGSGDASTLAPYVGHPVLSIYSYRWGGLDPANGDPLGYLNGQISNNYGNITSKTTAEELVYNGPVNPTIIGAFRNDFYWNGFSVSVNITCKMGYYFRRPSIDYGEFLNYWSANKDYAARWKKPGDEAITQVPSIPTQLPTAISKRDYSFYSNASVLVEKGDHIRLQDIVLGYDLNKEKWSKLICKKAHIYCNISNVGILWRANKHNIDPDAVPSPLAVILPQPRRITLGAQLDF